MKRLLLVILTFVPLLLFSYTGYCQAHFVMSNGYYITVDGRLSAAGTLADDGDSTGNYSNGFYGMIIIEADLGDTISVWGGYSTESCCDVISIFDGRMGSGTQLGTWRGEGSLSVVSYTGYLTVLFSTDGSETRSGFLFNYEVRPTPCSNNIVAFAAREVGATWVGLKWTAYDTSANYLIHYGSVDTLVRGSSCRIEGLSPLTNYTFTIVSEVDTALAECVDATSVSTTRFKADVSGLRPLCGMDTLTLVADSADAYLWSTGSTARQVEVWDTGVYYLVAYTNGGYTDTFTFRVGTIQLDLEFDLPTALCPGDTALVTVGMAQGSSIRVQRGESTLSESSRIFLPDGQYCEPNGCSYRSELLFSGFESSAHITDVNDIRYVMLNIEHSYVGDIYINITCPNNQSADILKYGGSGTSSCNSSITASSRGWQPGSNVPTSSYLGQAYDYESGNVCDSTSEYNEPGVGWRYCWSNCTDAGFAYAAGDGLVYRSTNLSSGWSLDSSDVAAGTHFYHPDDPFTSLVGCPMNGVWYIEVIDGWSGDNGYIFGWELALNPNRLPRTEYVPTVAYADMEGPYATRWSDTAFVLHAPLHRTTDTTVAYRVLITDSLGCVFDTSFTVVYHAASNSSYYDTVMENDLPHTYGGQTFNTDAADVAFHFPSSSGCDSLLLYNLHVIRNSQAAFDTTVCSSQLPLQWYHRTFTSAGTQHDTLANHLGADSLLELTLRLYPSYSIDVYDTICSNGSYLFEGTTYTAAGNYPHQFLSSQGCDSVRLLHLATLATSHADTFATACDQMTWYGHSFTSSGTFTIPNLATNAVGCDSAVTLHVTINPSYATSRLDTICAGDSILLGTTYRSSAGFYSHTFASQAGCDSVVVMLLTVSPTTYGDYYDTCVENGLPHHYGGLTLYDDTTAAITLVNSRQCDSILTYHLHVLRNSYAVFDTAFCARYFPLQWYHRIFYAPGTQYDTIPNAVGADSILTLNLAMLPNYYDTGYVSICEGGYYVFEGDTLTTAGYHTHSYVTNRGCDSLHTLYVTLLPNTQGDTFATACDHFTWGGTMFSTSDTFTVAHYATNVYGCDSAVTLHLTIRYSTDTNIMAEACDSYNWFGTSYLVPPASTPVHTLINSEGCDSTLRLVQLTLHYSTQTQDFDTVCQQQIAAGYQWRDTLLQGIMSSTTVFRPLTDQYGCDSLLFLSLTVYDSSTSQVFDSITENQAATWQYNGVALSADTVVQITLTNQWGCDSVVTYHLHVWPNVSHTIDTTLCDNNLASFTWNGMTAADTLVAHLVGNHGVDSMVTLIMHVNPTYQIDVYDTICDDATVFFAGQTLSTTGDYGHTFTSQLNCDSVVALHLTVHPTYSFHFYDTVYVGDTIHFEGNNYIQPGDYTITYLTANGCDSLLTLHLEGRNILWVERVDSLCEGETYDFYGRQLTEAGVYTDTAFSGDFFAGDTIVKLTLIMVERPEASIVVTPVCEAPAHYILEARTDVDYLLWEGPGVVEGHEHDSLIAIYSPADTSLYRLYADYRPEQFCPAIVDTLLPPVPVVHALIDVRPSALTIEERHITATHASWGPYTRHLWYVFYNEEAPFTDTVHRLQLDVPMYVDSLALVLDVSNDICTSSDTVHVGVLRADILFPNVFTPSLSTNNIFKAYTTAVSEFELWIYDRRGGMVFHTKDIDQGWDGTHEGNPCPQAAYVYKCRYRDQLTPEGYQTLTGTVTLLR